MIFGLVYLIDAARFLWPLHLPVVTKAAAAAVMFAALQYHEWCRLSSGSRFSPEFPRVVVILFNWAFGGLFLLVPLQVLLDAGLIATMPFRGAFDASDDVRYAIGLLAAIAAAIGVQQAIRVPPLKDVEIGIPGLPREFDGYTLLHLTDLHVSRLYPAAWARAVVERSNALGVDLIPPPSSARNRLRTAPQPLGVQVTLSVVAIELRHGHFPLVRPRKGSSACRLVVSRRLHFQP